jgi:hypothetical protein
MVQMGHSKYTHTIGKFVQQLLELLALHEHWMDAGVCLDTPEQLCQSMQLQAAGLYGSMYRPLLDDTTVLFLPRITPEPGSIRVPFVKAAMGSTPCFACRRSARWHWTTTATVSAACVSRLGWCSATLAMESPR